MALSGRIRHSGKGPLGSLDEVKQLLSEFFPGLRFVQEHGHGITQSSGFTLGALLLRLSRPRLPYWEGMYEGDQFILTFNLGGAPIVETIHLTVYGRGSPNATPLLEKLSAKTGWKVSF